MAEQVAEPSDVTCALKNRVQARDAAIHNWYHFVLGYPPHLVREYLQTLEADPERDWLFDPFCGTGTTPVEGRLQGFSTVSADANPITFLATRVKLSWDVDLDAIRSALDRAMEIAGACLRYTLGLAPAGTYQLALFERPAPAYGDDSILMAEEFDPSALLPAEAAALIPQGFISEKPLQRVLAVRYAIEQAISPGKERDFLRLALANTIVTTAGNIAFGPEIYRCPPREDADVLGAFASTVLGMLSDIQAVRDERESFPPVVVFEDDARDLAGLEGCPPIGVVITSPPYPNEKDYTRSTRLESVLLGLLTSKQDLRRLKSSLLRSNTRNVFVGDDDDRFVRDIPAVVRVAEEIESKRQSLGKTSGFERLYHRVVGLYFGGMYRHFAALLPHLQSGARCAYVVGDQMSFFRVPIRTAQLLADVALKAGYEVEGIQLWRTRRSTTTGVDLEENVLLIRRPEVAGGQGAVTAYRPRR